MSPRTQPEEETSTCGSEPRQSEAMQLEQEEETGQSQAGNQSHVIKNVDEIFHTIEGLMSKLRQLKEIEKAHHKLLKTLREPSVNQESEEQRSLSATVSRTPSLDRGSGDCEGALNLHLYRTVVALQLFSIIIMYFLSFKPNQAKRPVQQTPGFSRLDSDIAAERMYLQSVNLDCLHTDAPICILCQTLAPQPRLPFAPRPCMHRPASRTEPRKDRGWLFFVFLLPWDYRKLSRSTGISEVRTTS